MPSTTLFIPYYYSDLEPIAGDVVMSPSIEAFKSRLMGIPATQTSI